MPEYPYCIVDVFTDTPLEGNPLAVLPDGAGLDSETMQRVAREFNLSETVFVLPSTRSDSCARLRIFTPTMEMRFAGHPTIGASFVMRERGIVPRHLHKFCVEELVGPVPIRVDEGQPAMLWLTTPPITFGGLFDRRLCASVLGLEDDELLDVPPQLVSAGNPNVYVAVRDKASVDRAWIDVAGIRRLHDGRASSDCVFVFAPTPSGAYSRMFGAENGVVEDPATGSATGPLAAYMMQCGLVSKTDGTRFVSEQGTKMGRKSLLHVWIHGVEGSSGIDVGGNVVAIAEGSMRLPTRG